MKHMWMMSGVLALGTLGALAQAPAGAPAGANGICKDGTYSTAASKSGACRGHKGVQTWYVSAPAAGAPAAANAKTAAMPAPVPTAKPASSMPAPAPATTPVAAQPAPSGKKQSPTQSASARPTAAGGGPGLVWLNTGDNVYHCNGDNFYGKTKAGAYMSESDAKAKGGRPAAGKVCTGR